uniref:Uncharacterized protein n=1 Tax=Anguilla anguilla TaxID=7936 RepID=A0A0E9PM28_ANGAN
MSMQARRRKKTDRSLYRGAEGLDVVLIRLRLCQPVSPLALR